MPTRVALFATLMALAYGALAVAAVCAVAIGLMIITAWGIDGVFETEEDD